MDFNALMQQAIRFEEEAHDFYQAAAQMVKSAQAKAMLQELAGEEAKHKAKLQDIVRKGVSWAVPTGKREETIDLKIGDYLMPTSLTAKSDFQDALNVAIRREQASYDFYSSMAQVASPDARPVFEFLATEEMKHKNHVQNIYDQVVYQQF